MAKVLKPPNLLKRKKGILNWVSWTLQNLKLWLTNMAIEITSNCSIILNKRCIFCCHVSLPEFKLSFKFVDSYKPPYMKVQPTNNKAVPLQSWILQWKPFKLLTNTTPQTQGLHHRSSPRVLGWLHPQSLPIVLKIPWSTGFPCQSLNPITWN